VQRFKENFYIAPPGQSPGGWTKVEPPGHRKVDVQSTSAMQVWMGSWRTNFREYSPIQKDFVFFFLFGFSLYFNFFKI
jgi:hypothetical protein